MTGADTESEGSLELEFFWDVGSPYTYLASTQLAGLAERTGATVRYRPFLLGGVFKAVGNQPPAALAQRRQFLMADLHRWARQYGVSIKRPGEIPFPLNTLLPMRVAIAVSLDGRGEGICNAMLAAYWRDGVDVSKPEQLAPVLEGIGVHSLEVFEQAQTQAIKDRLRANTDEAVERGAFGAPTFFVGSELYFGGDRIHHVETELNRLSKHPSARE